MWFHGGGWVLGDVVGYDPICTCLAAEVGCVVVSVDYRLAPEHRAPTAAHDCVDATTLGAGVSGDVLRRRHLADGGGRRLAPAATSPRWSRRCCATTAIRLRHQALVYPATDLTMSSPSVDEHRNAPDAHDAGRWWPSASTTSAPGADLRDPAAVAAVRPARRASPRRSCRPPTSTRCATTASGTPPRCATRACRRGSRTTWGCRTASSGCPALTPVGRQQRWELVAELTAALAPAPPRLGCGHARGRRLLGVGPPCPRPPDLRRARGGPVADADQRFSNDCLQVQLLANCRQRDVYIVQPLVPPTQDHLMELLLMIDAARGASAAQITAVIPHYAYARCDKKDASRISLGGRLVADLIVHRRRRPGADDEPPRAAGARVLLGARRPPHGDRRPRRPLPRQDLDRLPSSSPPTSATPRTPPSSRGCSACPSRPAPSSGSPTTRSSSTRSSATSTASAPSSSTTRSRPAGSIVELLDRLWPTTGHRGLGRVHPRPVRRAGRRAAAQPPDDHRGRHDRHGARPDRLARAQVRSVAGLFAEAITRIHAGARCRRCSTASTPPTPRRSRGSRSDPVAVTSPAGPVCPPASPSRRRGARARVRGGRASHQEGNPVVGALATAGRSWSAPSSGGRSCARSRTVGRSTSARRSGGRRHRRRRHAAAGPHRPGHRAVVRRVATLVLAVLLLGWRRRSAGGAR